MPEGRHIPFQLPRQVKAIVDQLSHQYLLGQYAVVVVLARSALEAAVKRVMTALKSTAGSDLNKQLLHLEARGVLSKTCARTAHDIRHRGNNAIHHDLSMYEHRDLALESARLLVSTLIELRPYLDENRALAQLREADDFSF